MSLRIADASDPALEPYRDVADHRALERLGLFVAEGRLVVERLLSLPHIHLHSVAVTPAAAAAMAATLDGAPEVPVLVCDPALLEGVTGFNFHRGCIALAHRPRPLGSVESLTGHARLLALQGVGNPDNVGGLFRVASALGAGGVVLDATTADPLYRKAIRTSMGASLRVPFARVPDWPSGLEPLRDAGFRIVALTPAAGSIALAELTVERDDRVVLVLGSEGPGLGADVLRYADVKVRIPVDPDADSLNVVVAAGIALHALREPR